MKMIARQHWKWVALGVVIALYSISKYVERTVDLRDDPSFGRIVNKFYEIQHDRYLISDKPLLAKGVVYFSGSLDDIPEDALVIPKGSVFQVKKVSCRKKLGRGIDYSVSVLLINQELFKGEIEANILISFPEIYNGRVDERFFKEVSGNAKSLEAVK